MGAQEFKHCSVVSGKFLDFFFKLIMIILRTMTKNHNPKKNVNTEIFTYQRLPTEVSGDPEKKLLSAANKINLKTRRAI